MFKTRTLTVYINEHEDGFTFYEWELAGATRDEALQVLKDTLTGIGNSVITGVKAGK